MKEEKSEKKEKSQKSSRKKSWGRRILRIFGILIFFILILLVVVILVIRTPWGQDFIVGKATHYVSEKTETEVSIDRLFITFSGKIDLEGLYLEDQQGDTLLYSKDLKAGIPLWPIIKGDPISINRVEWTGVRANVSRLDSIENFNYQFLIDAFTEGSEEEVEKVKEEDAPPPKIAVKKVDLSDFKLVYVDSVTGMDAKLNLGKFSYRGRNIDLEKMRFEADRLDLEDTDIFYEQSKPVETEEDSAATTLPFLALDNLNLKNVKAHYKSEPDEITADVYLGEFGLQVPKADLANNDIEVGDLLLTDSDFKIETAIDKDLAAEADKQQEEIERQLEEQTLEIPNWNIAVNKIDLQNNNLAYHNTKQPEKKGEFDANHIDITDFTLNIEKIGLAKKESAKAKLNELSFKEAKGFELKKTTFDLALDNENLQLNDFTVKTNESSFSANLNTNYASLNDLINHPDKANITLDLTDFYLDLKEAYQFAPELKQNEYFVKLTRHPLRGKIKAKGGLKNLDISNLAVNWGNNTQIQTSGNLRNLDNPEQLRMNLSSYRIHTIRQELLAFVAEEDIGFKLPENVHLQGNLYGTVDDLKTKSQLKVPEGQINIDGAFANKNLIDYAVDLEVIDFKLGEFLEVDDIGLVAFNLQSQGKGKTIDDLTADLSTEFSKLEYDEYDFAALKLNGDLDHGLGNLMLNYVDEYLDLDINNKISLDSLGQKVSTKFELNEADLQELNLLDKDILAKLMMDIDFENKKGDMSITTHISEAIAHYEEENHHLGIVDFSADLKENETSFNIGSNFINGYMESSGNVNDIAHAFERQFKRYFSDSITPIDSIKNPIAMDMDLTINENELITNVFVPEVKDMDTVHASLNFVEKEELLTANVDLPKLDVAGNVLKDLFFNLNATKDAGQYILGFEQLDAGAFGMNRTILNGDLDEGILTTNFYTFNDQEEIFYALHGEAWGRNKQLKFRMQSGSLMLNGEDWTIPDDNELSFSTDSIKAQNFVLTNGNQKLEIADDLMDFKRRERENIGIGFENFELSTLLGILNPDEHLAEGLLQGKLVAVNPRGKTGLIGDLGIDRLHVLQTPLGDLSLKAFSRDIDKYRFKLDLKGEDTDMDLVGNYTASEDSALDVKLDINEVGMKTLSGFSQGELKEASGYLSGKFEVNGKVSDPDYKGFLQFNDAEFNVAQLNSEFYLTDDKILINNKGLLFKDFSIEDYDHNNFYVDGYILTNKFINPEFNLTLDAKNFRAMNSTRDDNKLYYGKANFDLDGKITGRMNYPDIDLDIKVNKETDVTYEMSAVQASVEKRDGIVTFVNKADLEDEFTKDKEGESNVSSIKGMNLHARIDLNPKAKFGVVIDPRSGDHLEILGEANLDFRMGRNGEMHLSGRYIVEDGHYKMSLYNLVTREFTFKKGSTIVWNGDPMDADLNLTAIYKTKASAVGLMGPEAGTSEEDQNKYKQKLPFIVNLNVEGSIDKPLLSFGLDMEEDSKGAIGGTVYSRVNQLNEDEGDLNRQVFSLLVLKQFFPDGGSDGGSGGFVGIARDNLADALGDQLSNFSDELLGSTGVKLNFGLDSYTDYQGESPEQRTDLSINAEKSLLNDRLVVKAGTDVNVQGNNRPGEERALLGNVSIEYLLTEDGRWKLRGFRKDEYDNVIDGQVFVNGIGVVFERDFNQFGYLWRSLISDPKKYYQKKRKERQEKRKKKEKKEEKDKEEKSVHTTNSKSTQPDEEQKENE